MSSSPEVVKVNNNGHNNESLYDNESDNDDDDFEYDSKVGPTNPTLKSYDEESSIAKLPGSSLLRSVHNPEKNKQRLAQQQMISKLSNSVVSLKSDHTYDFDRKNSGTDLYEGVSEFGEDSMTKLSTTPSSSTEFHNGNSSSSKHDNDSKHNSNKLRKESPPQPAPKSSSSGAKVPAWKLREQARRGDAPPPPKNIIGAGGSPTRHKQKGSPIRTIRKTNSSGSQSSRDENNKPTWFQKLVTKKETPEEQEKRLKSEALIEKQTASRWGKDILEEDNSVASEGNNDNGEEGDDDDDDDDEKSNGKETKQDGKQEKSEDDPQSDDDDEEEEESDTIKRVKAIIEKSFGSALIQNLSIKKEKKKKSKKKNNDKDKDEENDDTEKAASANGTSGSSADGDDDGTSEDPSPTKSFPTRGNRWAMMKGAAATSVRNMQRNWSSEDTDAERIESAAAIAEEDDNDNNKEEGDDGDKVADIQPQDSGSNRRRSAMWKNRGAAAFTSVRNAWGKGGDEPLSSSHADDGLDSKSVHSEPDRLDRESLSKSNNSNSNNHHHKNNNIRTAISNFWQHTRLKFDSEVWNDPAIQETMASIEKLRKKIHDSKTEHKFETRRRERQIENSILQQKTFLARKLHRQMYGYKKDPYDPCVKEVYEKEILIIVHEVTSLGGDDVSEKDDIDELLDSNKFDYDYHDVVIDGKKSDDKRGDGGNSIDDPSVNTQDTESGNRSVNHRNSIVPLQTRVLRAQHNELMTDHQMELARGFQQKSVEHLYDLLPELQKDHEQLKAIPQHRMDAKLHKLQASNEALQKSYQAHVEAQEAILAIYRERYVPSVHEDDENNDDNDNEATKKERNSDNDNNNDNGEDAFDSPPKGPPKGPPKRPGMWAKNLQQSVRGIFGPKKDDHSHEERNNAKDDDDDDDGFSLASPITGGSLSKNKFILSFGSPVGTSGVSGILANFSAPSLAMDPPLATTSGDDDDTANDDTTRTKKLNQHVEDKDDEKPNDQKSAKDFAAAAWTVPKMATEPSLADAMAEKRAKRAAARRANRPDAVASGSSKATTNGTTTTTTTTATSRSELLQRARKARKESAAALGASAPASMSAVPGSPTPSGRSGRSSLRSSSSFRKELSMKDLMAAAGDSRRKLMENDLRMERLAHKKNQLEHASPLSSPSGASQLSSGRSAVSEERRLRIQRELRRDDSQTLNGSSAHSLIERKPRTRSLKKPARFGNDDVDGDGDGEPTDDNER